MKVLRGWGGDLEVTLKSGEKFYKRTGERDEKSRLLNYRGREVVIEFRKVKKGWDRFLERCMDYAFYASWGIPHRYKEITKIREG